jgi:site-specific recombinase XerD
MSSPQPAPADRQLPRGHLLTLNRSFRRTLEAENKSPRTIEAYTDAVRLLATHSQAHDHPLLVGELQREHIQAFLTDQLARWKPATAHNRYRGLHAFFILLLVDTGMRRAECAGMSLDDVDLDQRIVWVLDKGRRARALPIGRKTAQALDRYLRTREGHRLAYLPHLWVGRNGVHDAVGCLPGGPRSSPGRWATGHASSSAPARLRDQLAGRGW